MLGEKFGDYEIVRLIGRGGMGAVYEAMNANISRRAAIKVLLPEFAKEDDTVRRFFNEARAVNTINHPGVVQVSDVGKRPDGSLYLVMEFLEGETLTERLQGNGGKLPESVAVTVSWQLAGVLAAAHSKAIIHRDMKPGNIMLVPDMAGPDGERVKLLDFGIAKLSGTGGEDANTRKGQLLGTATYMAPEQFQSDQPIDGQSDVYSLAIVMYRMLSGKVPFTSTSGDLGLAAMHLFQNAPSLKTVAPDVSPWLIDLVDSMLRKEREKRPTMAEVLDELQRHVRFRPASKRLSGSLVRISASELQMMMDDGDSADELKPVEEEKSSPSRRIREPGTFSSASVQLAALGTLWETRKPMVAASGAAALVLILGVLLLILRRSPPPAPPPDQAGENTVAAKPEATSGGEKGEKPPAVNPPPNPATEGKNPAGTGATKSGAASRNRGTPKKDARARGAKKPSIKIIN
ncbi:MAG TPA: serine/threonine-protein kinase [Pseudomonadota bacterium]|nr:serine/threonine-protein kinase [Pseudomonadota bacterium]